VWLGGAVLGERISIGAGWAAVPTAAYDASRTVATSVESLGARTVAIALPA